ncbi:MAG: NrsF family protein [Vicinamibacterales bacterium]
MKTDELIGRLAAEVPPVRPLAPPATRTAGWLLMAALYVAAGVGMVATGMVPGGANADPIYVFQQGLAVAIAVVAAFAAFSSVIPGSRRSATTLVGVMALAWLGAVVVGCLRDLQVHGTLGLSSQTDWPCVAAMVLGGGALWFAMTPMLRRGVPMTPGLTAVLGGGAALGIANTVACLTQPHMFSSVVLLWHGGTAALMLAFFAATGQRAMRWTPTRAA